jgi:hypothetical protein
MSHPNRNWQRRWRVDLAACTAAHENGLVVRFREHPEGGWYGEPVALPHMDDARYAARLMREAGEVYKKALDGRH